MDGELVYCNDVEGLQQELGCTHNSEEWRLFVDLSQFSLKAVLLHKGNKDCPLCPHEGNLREYGFAFESYQLPKIWMENMWRT